MTADERKLIEDFIVAWLEQQALLVVSLPANYLPATAALRLLVRKLIRKADLQFGDQEM